MSEDALYLFEDAVARGWHPFATTRPVGELLFGCLTLRARAERVLGVGCRGHLAGPALTGFDEPGAAPAVALGDTDAGRRIYLSARALLDFQDVELPDGPATLTVDGVAVGWVAPPGAPAPAALPVAHGSAPPFPGGQGPEVALGGRLIATVWELMAGNAERLRSDARTLWAPSLLPSDVRRVGEGVVSLGDDAVVEPGVVLDVRHGPIRLEAGVWVQAPARLTGPLWVGGDTLILGGAVGPASIGPVCRVRGEVADVVMLGYDNKAHEGYLGHAYLGRWVNLGALTTNSDLKNNYGPVRVPTPEGRVDTGLLKVGCFLGDHVRTGIGTLLNTGSVVGAGSNLFGGGMPPPWVPPFSWGSGHELTATRLDRFFETAGKAMARRSVSLTPGVREVLARAWGAAHRSPGVGPSEATPHP